MKSIDDLETLAKDVAVYQRKTWEGHDNKDIALCLEGAVGLYSILTDADTKKIMVAAKYLQEAFWLSDDAEEYQNFDSELEDRAYGMAGLCLHRSRHLVGLETDSVQYTINWWKAYRHNNKDVLVDNLVKEQVLQMRLIKYNDVVNNSAQEKVVQRELNDNYDFAKKCAGILLESAAEHKKKDWASVDKKLEEYFTHYLPRVIQFKE